MLLALKCMAVAFLAGYLVGAPLVWLARRGAALTETDWLYVPFVGIGAVTLVTHQLAYFDVRVYWSAMWIWGAAALLGLGLAARYGWRAPYQNCPRSVIGAALAVYAVHGFGLLLAGPDEYVGRMNSDRVNYISLAQFLIDVPFSTSWDDLGQRPYLVDGLKHKGDRIGAMALLGFLSVTSAEWANRMFEPTILLGPALVVPALVLVCRALRFPPKEALFAAVAGALVPGLTTLHTSCYLANVTGVPFLLASTAATAAVVTAPTVRRVLLTAALYAATASLYTEFVPVLLAVCAAGAVLSALVVRDGWVRPVAAGAVVVALATVLAPRSESANIFEPIRRTVMNTSDANPMAGIRPHHLLGTIWVNDLWALTARPDRTGLPFVLGALLSGAAGVGVARLIRTSAERPGERARIEGAVLGMLVACLVVAPVLLLLTGRFEYQSRKLLLSFSPLLVLGAVAALSPRQRAGATEWLGPLGAGAWRRRTALGLTALFALGTGSLVSALSWDSTVPGSMHRQACDPWMVTLKAGLRAQPVDDIVLALGPGAYLNSELCFAARRHRVWLACPEINDLCAVGCPEHPFLLPLAGARNLVDLTTVPREATVYTLAGPRAALRIEGDARLVREFGPYQIWRAGPAPYRLVATEYAQRPPNLDHPSPRIVPSRENWKFTP